MQKGDLGAEVHGTFGLHFLLKVRLPALIYNRLLIHATQSFADGLGSSPAALLVDFALAELPISSAPQAHHRTPPTRRVAKIAPQRCPLTWAPGLRICGCSLAVSPICPE